MLRYPLVPRPIPPCESPLEEFFAKEAVKYLDPASEFASQVTVQTICGHFRLDFIARAGERRVAFECDGEEFHDPRRDEWRDAMILGAGAVDCIYRFRGADLHYHLEDCLYVASRWDPSVFGDRGCFQLARLASDEVRACREAAESWGKYAIVGYGPRSESAPTGIIVERRFTPEPPGRSFFWRKLFEFAQKVGGGPLDDVIRAWDVAHPWPPRGG